MHPGLQVGTPRSEATLGIVQNSRSDISSSLADGDWVKAAVLIEAGASLVNFALQSGENATAAANLRSGLLDDTETLVDDSEVSEENVESQVGGVVSVSLS